MPPNGLNMWSSQSERVLFNVDVLKDAKQSCRMRAMNGGIRTEYLFQPIRARFTLAVL